MIQRSLMPAATLFCVIANVSFLVSNAFAQFDTAAGPPSHQLCDLGYSSDGSKLIIGGDCVRIYDANSAKLLKRLKPNGMTLVVKFSPAKPNVFATRSQDGTIRVWQMDQADPVVVFQGLPDLWGGFIFSPDGKLIVSFGSRAAPDKSEVAELKVLEIETGKTLRSIQFDGDIASTATISNDGKLLALGKYSTNKGAMSKLEIYELEKWALLRTIPFGPGVAQSISFTPDNQQIVISGAEFVVSGPRSTKEVGKIWIGSNEDDQPSRLIATGFSGFKSAAQMPDNEHFITSTETMRTSPNGLQSWMVPEIQLRGTKDGEVFWSFEGTPYVSYGVQISPNKELVACCFESSIVLLDAKSGRLEKTIFVNE